MIFLWLWCIVRGTKCLNLNEEHLFRVIKGQTHYRTFLACQNEFDPLNQYRMSLFKPLHCTKYDI